MKLDAESYLKSGSNELRVLEYTSCGHSFGINILKVQKIISHPQCLTSGINTHPSVVGIIKDNDVVIPLIDLGHFLGFGKAESLHNKKVIVTEFFNVLNAFLVNTVEWIHHFVWEDVINANDIMKSINQKYVISIVKPDGLRMVPLLDYETIILDLCPELGFKEMEEISSRDFSGRGYRVLIVEDSPSIRNMVMAELLELGFEVVSACDGREAVDILETDKKFSLVITDVEMPRMDGLALTSAIRTDPEIEDMPVIVYSSIGDIGMRARAEFLKASAHVTKLGVKDLMANVIKLVSGEKTAIAKARVEAPGESASPNFGRISFADAINNEEQSDPSISTDNSDLGAVTHSAAAIAEQPLEQNENGNESCKPVQDISEAETETRQTISNEEIADMMAEQPSLDEQVEIAVGALLSREGISNETESGDKPEIILDAGRVTVASAESVYIVEANSVSIENANDAAKELKAQAPVKKKECARAEKNGKKTKTHVGNPALRDWPIGWK